MTLVVASIHDEDKVTIVSDTKVTWDGDDARTRHTYENALAKIVILREDLAVGVAGHDPHGHIQQIADARDSTIDQILQQLQGYGAAGFVVAALRPARLWMVGDGKIEERTTLGRAWQGDKTAYARFQESYARMTTDEGVPFRLLSSMQALTSFDPVPYVGGYTIRTVGTPEYGFLFPPDRMVRMPELQVTGGRIEPGRVVLTMEVPPDADATISELIVFVGRDPTRGAIGFLNPRTKTGRLFRQELPGEAVLIPASTPGEFVSIARSEHGQTVVYSQSGLGAAC